MAHRFQVKTIVRSIERVYAVWEYDEHGNFVASHGRFENDFEAALRARVAS